MEMHAIMKMPLFEMERMQSTWENLVDFDLAESGVPPVTLRDLAEMGLDLERLETAPLGYSQTNGTIETRQALSEWYPGTTVDHIELTNGASEANFLVSMVLLRDGDEVVFESPNYMQLHGIPPGFGATIKPFSLRPGADWEPDWDAFERALSGKTRLVYVTNPNNPTGAVLARQAMERIVAAVDKHDAYLIADEVYRGSELDSRPTPSFWGMSERVIVTSGLSKAFGIPGARIGWLVGPPDFVAECWAQHDYISIGPGRLSDMITGFVVRPENRKRLFARGAEALNRNLKLVRQWAADLDGLIQYTEPRAGAFVFARYHGNLPSVELAERLRTNQSVLVVPGAQLGLEGYLRIGIGVPTDKLERGLARITVELKAMHSGKPA
jgi:aspartate/methionine/tyrosine aminotransferase